MRLTSFLPQDLRVAVDRSYDECSDGQGHVEYKISVRSTTLKRAAGPKLADSSNLRPCLRTAHHGVLPSWAPIFEAAFDMSSSGTFLALNSSFMLSAGSFPLRALPWTVGSVLPSLYAFVERTSFVTQLTKAPFAFSTIFALLLASMNKSSHSSTSCGPISFLPFTFASMFAGVSN